MIEGVKKLGRRGVWLLVAIVMIALLVVLVYPQIRAIWLQSRVGEIIEEYVAQVQQDQQEAVEGNFYCIFPTLIPEFSGNSDLEQAILWLNEAKSLAPKNAHSSFLLGQAYCLTEDYERAIEIKA